MSDRPRDCCKDCWDEWLTPPPLGGDMTRKFIKRPAPNPGPRCATHWRRVQAERKATAHENRVQKVYRLNPGDYERIYRHQSGVCAICKRATGKTRRLSVDHDHATGKVRGLLCRPCNDMLGHARDSDMFFYRAAGYLQRPPASEVLNDGE